MTLPGSPVKFQHLMDIVVQPHQAFAATYLDGVIIYSSSWAEHMEHLQKVLTCLRKAGLMANAKKCHFGLTEAHYLGYRIGRGSLKPQDRKVAAVMNLHNRKPK